MSLKNYSINLDLEDGSNKTINLSIPTPIFEESYINYQMPLYLDTNFVISSMSWSTELGCFSGTYTVTPFALDDNETILGIRLMAIKPNSSSATWSVAGWEMKNIKIIDDGKKATCQLNCRSNNASMNVADSKLENISVTMRVYITPTRTGTDVSVREALYTLLSW